MLGIWPPLAVDWLVESDGRAVPATPGQVALSSCPGRPDGELCLRPDLERLAELGISAVVSLVEPSEMAVYGVVGLHEALRAAGLAHIEYPFPDGQPPPDVLSGRLLVQQILGLLGEGTHVLVHCIGGWGRSGTVAAALLCHEGYGQKEAIACVRRARDPRCVQSMAQERFVQRYHQEQQRYVRKFWPVRARDVRRSLTGAPGRRQFTPGMEQGRPMSWEDLRAAPAFSRDAQELVLLSGEMLRAEQWPPRQGCQPVDRAYSVTAEGVLTPVPLGEAG